MQTLKRKTRKIGRMDMNGDQPMKANNSWSGAGKAANDRSTKKMSTTGILQGGRFSGTEIQRVFGILKIHEVKLKVGV